MNTIDAKDAQLYQPYRMNKHEYFIIISLEKSKEWPEAVILRYNKKYMSGDHRLVGFYKGSTKIEQSEYIDKMFLMLMFEVDPENIVEAV